MQGEHRTSQSTISRKSFRMVVLGLALLVLILLSIVSPQPFWVDRSWLGGSAGTVIAAAFLLLLTYRR